MILVLHYEGESKDSKAKLLQDAQNIQAKLKRKGKPQDGVILAESDYPKYMSTPDSKADGKIHIVAHGNWVVCGHFNPQPLGEFLVKNGLKSRKNIKKITLHTCHSGSLMEGKDKDEDRFVHQLAAYLAGALDKDHYIEVRGAGGESYTDSTGQNWVLQEGVSIADIPVAKTREQELKNMEKFMQPRATARPKFAVSAGVVFDA